MRRDYRINSPYWPDGGDMMCINDRPTSEMAILAYEKGIYYLAEVTMA
jgi:hypothetical protein